MVLFFLSTEPLVWGWYSEQSTWHSCLLSCEYKKCWWQNPCFHAMCLVKLTLLKQCISNMCIFSGVYIKYSISISCYQTNPKFAVMNINLEYLTAIHLGALKRTSSNYIIVALCKFVTSFTNSFLSSVRILLGTSNW